MLTRSLDRKATYLDLFPDGICLTGEQLNVRIPFALAIAPFNPDNLELVEFLSEKADMMGPFDIITFFYDNGVPQYTIESLDFFE